MANVCAFHTIKTTKYLTLVQALFLFCFYGIACYDGFYMLLWIFHCTKNWQFQSKGALSFF